MALTMSGCPAHKNSDTSPSSSDGNQLTSALIKSVGAARCCRLMRLDRGRCEQTGDGRERKSSPPPVIKNRASIASRPAWERAGSSANRLSPVRPATTFGLSGSSATTKKASSRKEKRRACAAGIVDLKAFVLLVGGGARHPQLKGGRGDYYS